MKYEKWDALGFDDGIFDILADFRVAFSFFFILNTKKRNNNGTKHTVVCTGKKG